MIQWILKKLYGDICDDYDQQQKVIAIYNKKF